jgi:integrase
MATIRFLIQGKSDNTNIYVRLSISRDNVFKRKTGLTVNPNDWSKVTGFPIQRDEDLKNLTITLEKLRVKISEKTNDAVEKGVFIDGNWLLNQIDEHFNKRDKVDLDQLVNYFNFYIESLYFKNRPNGEVGLSERTIQKYKTIKEKIVSFEKHKKKKYYLKDINLNFRKDFIKYLSEEENLSKNTIGRYIPFIKTVCRDAKENGYETSIDLNKVKGYTIKSKFEILTFDELEKIENTHFTKESLENAKDWLIIGCYLGQRVSDLLKINKQSLTSVRGLEMVQIIQQKTGKNIAIPLHDTVKKILLKRNGEFPRKISDQRFNEYIKDVARIAGLNNKVYGNLINPETKRKEQGIYEKWQLVSSHICRRSFASNFYGDIPTPLLIGITGHSTERQVLDYRGKPPTDNAVQVYEYWSMQSSKSDDKTKLTTLRKAN